MAPHSSILAWKIPRAEKPGGLQSMGSLRVGHDWVISLWLLTFMHWRRKWQSIQCSCLENPKDGRAWWAAVYGVAWSRTRLKQLSSSSSHTSYCQDFLKSQHFSKCVHGSNYGFNLNFLVINDVDYVFIVATHVSSLMTCLFRYFTLFGFFWTCWEAYGISVPQPRIESGLQQWKSGILTKTLSILPSF